MLALFCWSVAVAQILFFKSADTSKTLQKEQRYAIIAVAYLWFWGDSMERILHNTRKRIVAICFSAFNTIMLLSHFGPLLVVLFQNFEHTAAYLPIYLMPLITPILALVFFLTPKKEYRSLFLYFSFKNLFQSPVIHLQAPMHLAVCMSVFNGCCTHTCNYRNAFF